MKLININKARYRRHVKIVMALCALGLAIASLAIAQLLIALFPHESGSHFHWNLLGVIATVFIIAAVLQQYRHHDFMKEVIYVWELKQSLNKITRKLKTLNAAAEKGDKDALLALRYSYAGSRQLWELDDNTLIMNELAIKQAELNHLADKFNIVLNVDDYDESILKRF